MIELQFAALQPGKIVPIHPDRRIYIDSERGFYCVLIAYAQVHCCGRAHPPQQAVPVPRLQARGKDQLWNWDITSLSTSVCGIWLNLYWVIKAWLRKEVAWHEPIEIVPRLPLVTSAAPVCERSPATVVPTR